MEIERQVAAQLDTVHEVDMALAWLDGARALTAYLRDREARGPMHGAQRRLEARIGQLLGKASMGPQESSVMTEDLDRNERHEFRLMRLALDGRFDGEDWWVSRRAMLRAIKNPGSANVTRHLELTGEIEWYTPRQYLDAAIEVMGAIELDPASSDRAQQHVRAEDYFTLDNDGLTQAWHGRVFLNPPYRMPDIKNFVFKLAKAYETGEIEEGILLTNSATDTEWFHRAMTMTSALCFTRGRIKFLEAGEEELIERRTPTHGQAFFYFGPHSRKFRSVFRRFGGFAP
jgi:phage N-6-adenine-methyltransferase